MRLLLLLLASCTLIRAQDETPLFDIPKLDAMVIDADAADWGERGFRIELLASPIQHVKPPADCDPRVRLAWDAQGLLALVTVLDDENHEHPEARRLWQRDCVELYLADRRHGEQLVQFLLGPGLGEKFPELRVSPGDYRKDPALKAAPPVIEAQRAKIEGGYRIEARIPWSNLNIEPAEGREIGVQIFVDDYEPARAFHIAAWYPGLWVSSNRQHMHRVRLAAAPSPPVDAVYRAVFTAPRTLEVTVQAAPALLGKPLVATQGATQLAEIPLAEHEGRARGRLKLELPAVAAHGPIALRLDGRELAQLPPEPVFPKAEGLVGPMVGAVMHEEAQLWAYLGPDPKLEAEYRAEAAAPDTALRVPMRPERAGDYSVKARLTGLKPDTAYVYRLVQGDKTDTAWSGSFRTAPEPGSPAKFGMAFASCMRTDLFPKQPPWLKLLDLQPAFMLLLGDNVYADTTDREALWRRHLWQRQVPEYAAALKRIPAIAAWDDHDYGPNDSCGLEPGKEESLRTFIELYANPAYGLPDTPGVFYTFAWGDVELFVTDNRYHKSPNFAPDDEQKTVLGAAQFAWLTNALKQSKARFKLLCSGGTLNLNPADCWMNYPGERDRLFKFVREEKIGGLLFLSGDVHHCRTVEHPAAETAGYTLHEIVSSGIANSKDQGFVTLDFDTTLPDPTVRIRVHHVDGSTPVDRTLKRSELQAGE
ncbi:MAG: hypothetical protein AMXMBFR7_34810 [Planctomycetota bacterium]